MLNCRLENPVVDKSPLRSKPLDAEGVSTRRRLISGRSMVSQPYSIRDAYPEFANNGRGIARTERVKPMLPIRQAPSRSIRRSDFRVGLHGASPTRTREHYPGAIPRPKDDQPKVRPRRLAHTERDLNDPSPRDEYRAGDVPQKCRKMHRQPHGRLQASSIHGGTQFTKG